MRLEQLRVRGLTRYDREAVVDFHKLGDGVIVLAGNNGSGKTTLLEASGPGILYREMPTRKPTLIANWCQPGGARLQLVFTMRGKLYEAELQIDAKGVQAGFLKENGRPLVTGKVSDYDQEIVKLLGPKAAFYSSSFSCQEGQGKFAQLGVADRKAVFRYYLQLERADQAYKALGKRLDALDTATVAKLEQEAKVLAESIPGLEDLLAKATASLGELTPALVKSKGRLAALQERKALAALQTTYEGMKTKLLEAMAKVEELEREVVTPPEGVRPDPAPIRAKLDALADRKQALQGMRTQVERLRGQAELARQQVTQLEGQAKLLEEVPCSTEVGEQCKLLANAQEAKRKLEGAKGQHVAADKAYQEARAALAKAEEATPAHAEGDLRVQLRQLQEAQEEYDGQARLVQLHEQQLEGWRAKRQELRAQALETRRRLPKELPQDLPSPEAVALVEREVREQEELDRTLRGQVGGLEERVTRAKTDLEAKERAVRAERRKLDDLQPLRLVTQALGPNGIQAYEIDAAGPRVSAMANDLLRACYGGRFELQVRTTKPLAKGGYAEDFGITVVDGLRGREGDLQDLSPGERVVVDEALRMALALFAGERSGSSIGVLWRDEPSAGLDESNARAYVAMLHRAREVGGFAQVLVVSHHPGVIAGADAVIRVNEDGSLQAA